MSFYTQFAEHYEAAFPFREEVYGFLRAEFPRSGGRILDIGCGPGHYCGRLAEDGFRATGIDLDPQMISVARTRYPGAHFHSLDMRAIHRLAESFDASFCIGNVLAHLPAAQLPRFLDRLAAALIPGASWVFQTVNWDRLLTRESYRFPDKVLDNRGTVFRRAYDDISPARVRFRTRLEQSGDLIFADEVWLYPVRTDQYLQRHAEAGFRLKEHFADYGRSGFKTAEDSGSVFVFARSH